MKSSHTPLPFDQPVLVASESAILPFSGSGSLIIMPILNGAVGKYSVFATAPVCASSAMIHDPWCNIRAKEPASIPPFVH
jgi:hypothetical protein